MDIENLHFLQSTLVKNERLADKQLRRWPKPTIGVQINIFHEITHTRTLRVINKVVGGRVSKFRIRNRTKMKVRVETQNLNQLCVKICLRRVRVAETILGRREDWARPAKGW